MAYEFVSYKYTGGFVMGKPSLWVTVRDIQTNQRKDVQGILDADGLPNGRVRIKYADPSDKDGYGIALPKAQEAPPLEAKAYMVRFVTLGDDLKVDYQRTETYDVTGLDHEKAVTEAMCWSAIDHRSNYAVIGWTDLTTTMCLASHHISFEKDDDGNEQKLPHGYKRGEPFLLGFLVLKA